ncbi:MAG: hypothetical protein HYX22_03155 [Candidatus Yanofskybacteria bacterium]|nr:hypothetical protein [Candidatus Yanofskybacteria bacterium]
MKYVNIYKLQNDGEQRIIATCRLDDSGMVICEGDKAFTENLVKDGILDYGNLGTRNKLFPRDGIKFLENLKHAFKSGYLVATDVQE